MTYSDRVIEGIDLKKLTSAVISHSIWLSKVF